MTLYKDLEGLISFGGHTQQLTKGGRLTGTKHWWSHTLTKKNEDPKLCPQIMHELAEES